MNLPKASWKESKNWSCNIQTLGGKNGGLVLPAVMYLVVNSLVF
jgi:hypothetical protein